MKSYLEERIEWYDYNYRNGNALISDKQFDQLEKNLLRIDPNCDYFSKKNNLVLPSLEKGSIDEFLEGLLPDTRLLIEPKIDGCAIALQYRNGTLEKAISREGNDITSKIAKVKDIPKQLPLRGVFQIRGELYAPNQTPNFSQRIASGFLRAQEGFGESLSFCSFQILNSRLNQSEAKKYLEKLGFSIYPEPTNWRGIELAHHPDNRSVCRIAGHVHPQMELKATTDHLVCSCFAIQNQRLLLLPAFTKFSGGPRLKPCDALCFPIIGDQVLPPTN